MPRKPASPKSRKNYKGEKNLFFSENVRARRIELGLKQSELAERIGFKQSQVSDIEGGSFVDDAMRVVTLCRALETTPDYLFGFTEKEEQ